MDAGVLRVIEGEMEDEKDLISVIGEYVACLC